MEEDEKIEEEEQQEEVEKEEVKPKKKGFLKTKKGQFLAGAIAVFITIYATFFTASPLEPVVFSLKPVYLVFVLSVILSLFVTLVYKFMTDQTLMRELKKDMKRYQEQMRNARKDPTKVSELSKKSMALNMKYMHQSLKPMLITMLPFLLVFTWLRGQFDGLVIFNLPVWPHTLGWIGTYIIFSMIFTTVMRKVLGVV